MSHPPINEPRNRGLPRAGSLVAIIGVSIAAYAIVIGGATWLANRPSAPRNEATLLLAVAVPLAHSSLAALWWARSTLPSYVKTFLAAAYCFLLWTLLVLILPVDAASPGAAGWGLSLVTQAMVTALGATLLQVAMEPAGRKTTSRFSLAFLFLWTAVVAAILAGGRWIADFAGWTAADVLGWEYLLQLQGLAVGSALLALALFFTVRLRTTWWLKAALCTVWLLAVAATIPALMNYAFTNVGATYFEIALVLGGQGVFLLAALVPWQMSLSPLAATEGSRESQ